MPTEPRVYFYTEIILWNIHFAMFLISVFYYFDPNLISSKRYSINIGDGNTSTLQQSLLLNDKYGVCYDTLTEGLVECTEYTVLKKIDIVLQNILLYGPIKIAPHINMH